MAKAKKNTKKNEVTSTVDLNDFMSGLADVAGNLETEASELAVVEAAQAEQAAIEAQAKADEAPAVESEPVVVDEPFVPPHVEGNIKEMIANVTPGQREQKAKEILSEVEIRFAHDTAGGKVIGSGTQNSFRKARNEMASLGQAGFFVAADIDPSFINRSIAGDKRFNIYAIDKIVEIVRGVDGGFLQNPIVRSVLLSMFNFRDAGLPFTKNAMEAAISSSVKVNERAMIKHLVRHTVSASTAPTQTSQMRHALTTLGIATRQVSGRNTEVFTLTDSPTTRRLEQVLRAA